MKRILAYALIASMISCGSNDNFSIKGEVAGSPTMNLYVRYYGDNAVMSGVTAVRNGQFEFKGQSKQPALIEILDNEGRALGRIYVANGDKVRLKLDRLNPYKIEATGTPINEEWSRAVRAHADSLYLGSHAGANRIVEEYIAEHPTDVVSALMFATIYDSAIDPVRADSVVQSIEPAMWLGRILDSYVTVATPYSQAHSYAAIDTLVFRTLEKDTAQVFTPAGKYRNLLLFTVERPERIDSIVPRLRQLARERKDLRIIDISLATDTNAWKRTVRGDTCTWVQGWAPGGIYARTIDRLAIPHTPYYIVTDSAGTQLYRGTAFEAAVAATTHD